MVAEARSFIRVADFGWIVDKHLKRDRPDDSAAKRANCLLGTYLPRSDEIPFDILLRLEKIDSHALLSALDYNPGAKAYAVVREEKDGTRTTYELSGSHLRYSCALALAAKQEGGMSEDQRWRFEQAVKGHPAYLSLSKLSDEELAETFPLTEDKRKEMLREIRNFRDSKDEKHAKEIRADLVKTAVVVQAKKDRDAGDLTRKLVWEKEKAKAKDK